MAFFHELFQLNFLVAQLFDLLLQIFANFCFLLKFALQ